MKKKTCLFSKIQLFQESFATSIGNTSDKAIMLIPLFTTTGFVSSLSELDYSELDSLFFGGDFFTDTIEIEKKSWINESNFYCCNKAEPSLIFH